MTPVSTSSSLIYLAHLNAFSHGEWVHFRLPPDERASGFSGLVWNTSTTQHTHIHPAGHTLASRGTLKPPPPPPCSLPPCPCPCPARRASLRVVGGGGGGGGGHRGFLISNASQPSLNRIQSNMSPIKTNRVTGDKHHPA